MTNSIEQRRLRRAISIVVLQIAVSTLIGCSSSQTPLAKQSQTVYIQQQTQAAASYAAYMRTHGKTGVQ